MEKQQLLQEIQVLAARKEITKDELLEAYSQATGETITKPLLQKVNMANILYYIGGGIVFLGIAILVSENWNSLNDLAKVVITLGSGLAAYVIGTLWHNDEKLRTVAQAFFLISALLIPFGLGVLFDILGFDIDEGTQSIISVILLTSYLASFIIFRKDIFLLFSIIFATWFFYAFTELITGQTFDGEEFFGYRTIALGASYLLMGYYFAKEKLHDGLVGPLYGFGCLGVLGAALLLSGFERHDSNVFWELVYPFLAFGALFLSTHLKSKSFLTFGTLFLMIYILNITAKYFSDSMGWPLALVLAGFAMIGVGYYSVYLNKKYLKQTA